MMKRVVLLLVVLLCAAASYGQIPYKIKNPYLYQSWEGDSANVLIRNFNGGDPDSVLYQTTTPVYIMWSSVYWPAFSPGIADTNILFVDAATGQVGITSPAAIGGAAASKWTYTGSTLRPIDTAKYVAIGTTNARSKWLYVDGNYNLNDGWFKQLSDLWAGRRFTGMYGRYNAKQTWMNGMLDLTTDGFPHKMFFGYIYDTTTFGFTHRRIALTIDTIKGADLTASNVPGLPNEGVHVSAVSLTAAHVFEGDIEVDTLGVAMSRKIFNSTSQLQMRQFKVTDTGWVWVKQNWGDLNRYQKMKLDTNGYLTINNAYRLPNADGNPNDVMTTDGSGVVSWAAAAGGDTAFWQKNSGVLSPVATSDTVMVGQTANVGTERFGVTNGAVMFSGTTGATPTSGAGRRLMWIPSKGSFLAGNAGATSWDAGNIGDNVAVFGNNCYGIGNYSVVGGQDVYVSGTHGFGFGYSHNNTGAYAGSIGYNNETTGTCGFTGGQEMLNNDYNALYFGRYAVQHASASWVGTDPLFVLGNGTGTGASSNNAMTVLKNGSTYIGDASSTQDPVLSITTADSVATFLNEVVTPNKFAEYKPDHAYFTYSNNTGYTVAIATQNVWTDMSDSTSAKWTLQEAIGFTYDNDTMVYNGYDDGHIRFDVVATVKGGNGDDWEMRVYNVTDAAEVAVGQICTTLGAGNYISMPVVAYDKNANVGDRYIVQIRNLTNNDDPTIYRVMWYADVIHYK